MAKVTIGIEYETWKKLIELKLKYDLRTFEEIINFLIDNLKKKK